MRLQHAFLHWGRCPQTPGIYRVVARMASTGTGSARPQAIPAAGPALGSHPCVALSSAPATGEFTVACEEKEAVQLKVLDILNVPVGGRSPR